MQSPMYMLTLRVTGVALLLSLGACATMDRDQCVTADWGTIGFEDGVAGYAADRIGDHREACAEYGVTPDLAAYQDGRAAGLREYCVAANGFRLGSQGNSYGGVCPVEVEDEFVAAYRAGQELYTLQTRLSNVVSDLDTKQDHLRKAESDIITRSATAISSEATAEERARAVADVKYLGERIGRFKAEIRQLEQDRVQCERDLEDYRATLPYKP